jgi:hypothetical protein
MSKNPDWWHKPTRALPLTSFHQSANGNAKGGRLGSAAMMVVIAIAIAIAIAGVMFGFILPLNLAARSTVAWVDIPGRSSRRLTKLWRARVTWRPASVASC